MNKSSGRSSHQMYLTIKEEILSSKYKGGNFLPPVRTLSETYGFALATVWKALKALEADGFVIAIPRQGYRIKEINQKSAKSIIGYVLDRQNINYGWDLMYKQLLESAEDKCLNNQIQIMKIIMSPGDEEFVIEQIEKMNLDGVITDSNNEKLLTWAKKTNKPLVIIDDIDNSNQFDQVIQDGYSGGCLAGQLVDELKPKRISYIGKPVNHYHAASRLAGIESSLLQRSAKIDKTLILDLSDKSIYEQINNIISKDEFPDLIFCFWRPQINPLLTILKEKKLRIGKDINLCCWSSTEIHKETITQYVPKGSEVYIVQWKIEDMILNSLFALQDRINGLKISARRICLPMTISLEKGTM